MQSHLQRFSLVIVLLGIIVGLRVGLAAADGAGNTRLRFMHTLVNGPNVDLHVDDSRQVSNVAYGRFSGYVNIAPGGHRLKVFRVDTSELLVESDFNYEVGKDYTLFIMGLEGQPRQLKQFENQINVPEVGKAAVRFVNAAPNAPAVKVCITGTEDCRMQNATFAVATSYVLFDANSYNFDIRLMDNQVVFQKSNLQFANRVVYTLVAIGIYQNQPPLDLITVVDTEGPTSTPPTGAFLTPRLGLILVGLVMVLCGVGWLIWRQLRRLLVPVT